MKPLHTMPVNHADQPPDFEIVDILGIPVARADGSTLVRMVRSYLKRANRGWVCGINAHAINLSCEHPWMRDFYRHSLVNCSEGVGVSVASRLLGTKPPPRIVWAYWIFDLMHAIREDGSSVFLLGGTDEIAAKASANLRQRLPGLRIAGYHHGYVEPEEDESLVELINRSNADVLIVAMGMPKQEEWISRNMKNLRVKVAFPVGALLDYVSGVKKRCPDWMVVAGLEWLYRLLKEPGRMWKRYLIGNPLFFFRVIRGVPNEKQGTSSPPGTV